MDKQALSQTVYKAFEERFNQKPLVIASPGRINLIGEHVDYNNGFVFPAAIDRFIISGFALNGLNVTRIHALDMNETVEVDINELAPIQAGHWQNYITGVLFGLQEKNLPLKNFDMVFTGNIPLGAGLSSSAALENSVVFGLNELFRFGLERNEMARISQKAEHHFAGVMCGIMDQFASMNGQENHALFLDCDTLDFETIELNLGSCQLVLINTNVKHELSDSPYNERVRQCLEGLKTLRKIYGINSFRDATLAELEEIKNDVSEKVYNRCRYVLDENLRVKEARKTIEKNDWRHFGALLFETHDGLNKLYEVSCPELNFIVEEARGSDDVLGARMMGGGFGGCVLTLLRKETSHAFVNHVSKAYEKQFNTELSVYPVNITNGTHRYE